jgi:mannose-6-phosphate isomerase-like protein (cupin superfamily)
MSDYTILNLGDVENVAPKFGMPDGFDARFPKKQLECTIVGLAVEKYGPDTRFPFGHMHRDQEELYLVVEGSGRVKIEDEIRDVKQWDIVRVGKNTMRNFESGPDGMTVVAVGGPIAEERDSETVQGWWSD